jgi:hypothetical protein
MNIGIHGDIVEVSFWPADEIEAAFKRVNDAMGTPSEVEAMRLFVRSMNYFYEQSNTGDSEIQETEMKELCRLAKKALYAELGITEGEKTE